ncbi:MAG: DNA-binding response OmpR family regulator, partial [bacterium]
MSDLPVITQHIMVVEDDESLARWIADYLATHNFLVSVATRGDAALEMIRNDMPDAVILDLNLPVMDGLEVCRQARLFFDNPILMLTARDTDNDEVAGLDTGADDYLAKPVKPSILLARLRALLRRSQ